MVSGVFGDTGRMKMWVGEGRWTPDGDLKEGMSVGRPQETIQSITGVKMPVG